jgi:hypothetical protein
MIDADRTVQLPRSFPAQAVTEAAALLQAAAEVLAGADPVAVRYRAVVERAVAELDEIRLDPAAGRDPGLLLWRLATPGVLGALGAEDPPARTPGLVPTALAWAVLGLTALLTGGRSLTDGLPSQLSWLAAVPVLAPAGIVVAVVLLLVALVARSRRARVLVGITQRRDRLVRLEADLVGPLAQLRAASRPADFAGPASRAADRISAGADRLDAAAERLGRADTVVDRLGDIVTQLVAVLPDIAGEAKAVAAPFTAAADRIATSSVALDSATAVLHGSATALAEAMDRANWLALVADGLRHDAEPDSHPEPG